MNDGNMDQQTSFFGYPEKFDSWRKLLPYALLLSVTLALYAPTIYFDFVWDDFYYILDNRWIHGFSSDHLRSIWTNSFLGLYAPVHLSFLALLHSLSGLEPFGYHLGQLVVHAACVCLLYYVLEKAESTPVALLASLLFAVFPPNTENVGWISETKSTLALLFFLLSFRFFLKLRNRERWGDGVLCALFLVLSILSKIITVVAPAIFLLYDYKQGYAWKKGRVWSLACFFLVSAVFTGVHLATFRVGSTVASWLIDSTLMDKNPPNFSAPGSYFGGANIHLLNSPRLLLFYIRMAVFPYPLSAWHMFRPYTELNWITGAAWIALLGLLWLLYRSPRNLQFWQLWFYLFIAPVLQIVPLPIWAADRYLYIPAIGAFVLWSKLFYYVANWIGNPWLRLGWGSVTMAILLVFAWQTHQRLPVWQSDLSLWTATAKTCMTSAYCHGSLGAALLANGNPDLAAKELYQSVQIRPEPLSLVYLGDIYAIRFGDYRRALLAYGMAQQMGGTLPPDFWAKVAKVHYMAGELDQAAQAIGHGQKIDPHEPSLLLVNGFLQWRRGNREQARRSLQQFLVRGQRTFRPARLINDLWGNPTEVGQLLADLGPL